MNKIFIALSIVYCAITSVKAQDESYKNHLNDAYLLNIGYAAQLPAGDIANRFGYNFNIGGAFEYMSGKHNWIIGLEGGYLFGSRVKEDVLANLRSSEGYLFGINFDLASVVLRERGWYGGVEVGRLLAFKKEKPRSGLRVTLGAGWLQHKIRVQDDNEAFTQIGGDYIKGYDRLTGGIALNEFVGYQYISPKKTVNFYAGFEFTQGFTKNLRTYDFANKTLNDTNTRIDLLNGFRIGWTLPIYVVKDPSEIMY